MRGRFITVEGTEGVGKSTNIALVKRWLADNKIPFIATREPGGTPLAESLRELLLANRSEAVDATAELLMIFAARAQHLNTVIKPALESGVWVLSDRFTDATYAYQGCGRGLDLSTITQLEYLVQGDLHPDLTLYLDVDVSVGLERARLRGELDRFEQEDIAFFERVRQGYLDRVAANPDAYAVIDAGQKLEAVQQDLLKILDRELNRSSC
ncbi:dTMP kinase [Marinagarivorans algicola]|uniref:dTMP kinase n=1 Tax=Marinagarivorans algicola TaxID=1513270 RepID=UPI0006B529A1|nr:dTMP kinase [Marinagarivorans algicola]